MDINTHVYCINCVNFKPVGSCHVTVTSDDGECKNCICSLCDCDEPEDSMSFSERPLYIPKQ